MLTIAITLLTFVVVAGGWLGGLYLLVEEPPTKLGWKGAAHGAGGVIGAVVLWIALRSPHGGARALRLGAAYFGLISAVLISAAALGGLVILMVHLRRRHVSNALVAAHGGVAITGYVLLITYLTMLN